jgi:predicted ester cyclase
MTAAESNKAVVREYVLAFNHGDVARLRQLFTPDAVVHGVLGSGGLAEVIPIWRELHAAFGIELTIESLVAESDLVAARYTERGTFSAPFRGRAPTGRSYELTAMEWFVLRDGLICCRWAARDAASQARQIEG